MTQITQLFTIKKKLRDLILPITRINEIIPQKGLIYEIGSGYGGLSQMLAAVRTREVRGIDFNAEKIDRANELRQANLKFILADAASFAYEKCRGAVLSDFLHHVTYKNQEVILRRVYKKLHTDGVLCIKEISRDDGWRRYASRLWDFILYPHDHIYYRTKADWQKLLKAIGFKVKIERHVVWFPGSTWIFICTKS